MKTELECSSYRFADQDELCLRTGLRHRYQILIIPPLFDEMNRMRRMIIDAMRLLDSMNIGAVLPDLPGTNESLFPQVDTNLEIWEEALSICHQSYPECSFVASFRGGCLIDFISADLPVWRLTPVKGKNLLRTMMRTRIGSDKESGIVTTMENLTEQAEHSAIELAGNIISPKMFSQLQESEAQEPARLRTARLETDSKPANVKLSGSSLWLRAEPDSDAILSASIAKEIADWIHP